MRIGNTLNYEDLIWLPSSFRPTLYFAIFELRIFKLLITSFHSFKLIYV
jgi:hypothetical protein